LPSRDKTSKSLEKSEHKRCAMQLLLVVKSSDCFDLICLVVEFGKERFCLPTYTMLWIIFIFQFNPPSSLLISLNNVISTQNLSLRWKSLNYFMIQNEKLFFPKKSKPFSCLTPPLSPPPEINQIESNQFQCLVPRTDIKTLLLLVTVL